MRERMVSLDDPYRFSVRTFAAGRGAVVTG
jgi:hypothetical protein